MDDVISSLLAGGRLEDARSAAEERVRSARESGPPERLARALASLAEVRLAAREILSARQALDESLELAERHSLPEPLAKLYLLQARLETAEGGRDRAVIFLARAIEALEARPVQTLCGEARRLAVELDQTETADRLEAACLSAPARAILHAITLALEREPDHEKAAAAALDLAARAAGGDRGFILMFDARGKAEVAAAFNMTPEEAARPDLSHSAVRRAFASGEEVLIQDTEDDCWASERPSVRRLRIASVLCVPIKVDQRKLGIIYVDKQRKGGFSLEEAEILRIFARRLMRPLARAREAGLPALAGASPPMEILRKHLEEAALSSRPALLEGEPGTGKGLVAYTIHASGPLRGGPLVVAAAQGLDGPALESALDRATGGTLILDDVDALEAATQEALGRRLSEGKVPARLLSTTTKDLGRLAGAGAFRRDLQRALSETTIRIPPLRERPLDILPLADAFLAEAARETGSPRRLLIPEAEEALVRHSWPGNVRELRDVTRRAAFGGEGPIHLEDLPGYITGRSTVEVRSSDRYQERMAQAEKEFLVRTLAEHGNHVGETARALGIDRPTLRRRMEKLGIPPGEDSDIIEV